MIRDPEQIYLQLFETLDAIEDCFQYIELQYEEFDNEVEHLRCEMERVADRTITIAARTGDWSIAYDQSGFRTFRRSFEDLTERVGRMMPR